MPQEEPSEPHLSLTIDLYIDTLLGCQNVEVPLSANEHYILIDGFFKNRAKTGYCVCSEEELLHIVGGRDDDQRRSIRKAISGLRKKLEKACGHCCHIRHIEALPGYRMTDYCDCTIILPLQVKSLPSL